jgi:FixJ family two-component response regulator
LVPRASPRELQALRGVCPGDKIATIAAALIISQHTVDQHCDAEIVKRAMPNRVMNEVKSTRVAKPSQFASGGLWFAPGTGARANVK